MAIRYLPQQQEPSEFYKKHSMPDNKMQIVLNKDGLKLPSHCIIPENVECKDWLGSGKIGTWLVPDSIFPISMKKAGFIHDWMYQFQFNKKQADEIFYFNMKRLIDNSDYCKAIKDNARIIAKYYYLAVKWFGNRAYNKCKNSVTK